MNLLATPSDYQSPSWSRDSVREILDVLRGGGDDDARSWNIVAVLELLIEAGHFCEAGVLAGRVINMFNSDGRERLFNGYAAFCSLISDGKQSSAIATLERLYIEINHAGHSATDKVRIGLLLARALAVSAALGAISQGVLIRARSILNVELDRAAGANCDDLLAQVAIELAKCYLHAPTPDPRAAYAILDVLKRGAAWSKLSTERAFDVSRVLYQAGIMLNSELATSVTESALRDEAKELGPCSSALAELAIARRAEFVCPDKLDLAISTFIEHDFISGAYEAMFIRATSALDSGYNVVAERFFNQARTIALRGGFLHGRILATVGLFQVASLGNEIARSKDICSELVGDLASEVAIGTCGLNVAAAQQIVGDYIGALRTAKRCERFFKEQEMLGFQAQAANIIGTCEATRGEWGKARLAWLRALSLDEKRHAFIQACERRCLIAQALVMSDRSVVGFPREATVKKAHALMDSAALILKPLLGLPEALRVNARLEIARAQLSTMMAEHVTALKHFSAARGIFESLGMSLDVAVSEAFIGLSMLEVGKSSTPNILEEAVMHLQLSLQVLSMSKDSRFQWKLFYYLALGGTLISQSKASPIDKAKWRDLAASWLRSCEKELRNQSGETLRDEVLYEVGFAPGLTSDDVDSLKKALGMRDRIGQKGEKSRVAGGQTASNGYVH